MATCNYADDGMVCRANDGEACAECAEWMASEGAYWRRMYDAAPAGERMTAEERDQELRDAGRGHLVSR